MREISYFHTDSGDLECIVTNGHARRYPWHAHIRHRTVGLVRSGAVRLSTHRVAQRFLFAGDCFHLRRGEPHNITVFPDSCVLVLCFEQERGIELARPMLFEHYKELNIAPGVLESFLRLTDRSRRKTHLASMSEPNEKPGNVILMNAILSVAERVSATPERVWNIEEMADYAGYSPWHFLRSFRKVIGMTPHLFLQICRVRLLRSRLRTDTATAEIAASAGYTDQSHMYKVFKRHHGLTPGQFREASFKL